MNHGQDRINNFTELTPECVASNQKVIVSILSEAKVVNVARVRAFAYF